MKKSASQESGGITITDPDPSNYDTWREATRGMQKGWINDLGSQASIYDAHPSSPFGSSTSIAREEVLCRQVVALTFDIEARFVVEVVA